MASPVPAAQASPAGVRPPRKPPSAAVVLASQSRWLLGTGGFERLNFTLTPNASAGCVEAPGGWGAPPSYCEPGLASRVGHACLSCGGQLAITLRSDASVVDVDSAYLQPSASWGALGGPDDGVRPPARRDASVEKYETS